MKKRNQFKKPLIILAIGTIAMGAYFANAQQQGQVSLTIAAGTSSCVYGTDINLGSQDIASDFGALTFQGAFNTNGGLGTNTRSCTDANGTPDGWDMYIQMDGDLTNGVGNSIGAENVVISHDAPAVTVGNCTAVGATATNQAINTPYIIMGKASGASVCTIETPNVNLTVNVPANTAPGSYQGTISITLPTFM